VQKLGEPWTFGLRPPEVGAFLANCGLTLQEELGADDYRARYLPTAPHGYAGYAFYRLAVAARGVPLPIVEELAEPGLSLLSI
jgi:hypothetical protein